MRWLLLAAAGIVAYQTMLPPVVGLANQSDFKRVIGKFGYGPEKPVYFSAISLKYVPDASYREPDWEQFSSEDFFVRAALLGNPIISKDGKFDIRVMGLIHSLAFLAALAWIFYATRFFKWRIALWIAIVFIATDVAYVAYFNSFYAEPASYIFCLLLIGESIAVCERGVTNSRLARWSAWSVLLILAKPINAPLGALLSLFALRLSPRSWVARLGAAAIVCASVFMIATAPAEMTEANTYNLVFLSILPESRTPAADAASLGLPPHSVDYSGTGAWSPTTGYYALRRDGMIGKNVTLATVARFYLSRPTRMWRHITGNLRVAMLLRPELENFPASAGLPPGARSRAFSLWSDFHRVVLLRVARPLFLLLPVVAIVVAVRRWRWRVQSMKEDFFGLLALCCLVSFLTASFGDGWETVRHMFLFNVLLDTGLVTASMWAGVVLVRVFRKLRKAGRQPLRSVAVHSNR